MSRTPPLPSDVLRRVVQRDPEALDRFFEAFFDRAYGYVLRLVQDPSDAEDVVQAAFLKMHRAIHTLDPERDPTSWVFAVLSNATRDFWRSRNYKDSQRSRPLDEVPLASPRSADDEVAARDMARVLERALAGMSETLRAVVLLRDYEDLSYSEVAAVLGIEEAAARKRHSRALRELRQAVTEAESPMHKIQP